MPGKAAKVVVSERQHHLLTELAASRMCPQGLALRAAIILAAFAGDKNEVIAERLGCERHSVGIWRRRWQAHFDELIDAECCGRPGDLRHLVADVALADAPRVGRPSTYSDDQVAMIVTVACEPPGQSGRPISHWTHGELAEEVVKRGIVPKISARHLGRFLKGGGPSTAPQSLLA